MHRGLRHREWHGYQEQQRADLGLEAPFGVFYGKKSHFTIIKGQGEEITCVQSPTQGRSDHKAILSERQGHRASRVQVRRAPPRRQLQAPKTWSDITTWKDIVDKRVRPIRDCEGLQLGLAGARRDLEYEDEGDDWEDTEEKAKYHKVAAKRAALRAKAEAAPPADRARLHRAVARASATPAGGSE